MKYGFVGVAGLVVALAGCAQGFSPYRLTIDDYMAAAEKISLGMTKPQVVEILQPTQKRLFNTEIKQPDMYEKDGAVVEILYFRSGWQPDGINTDDEFTPYLFKDGKLVSVGWTALGGPKTHALPGRTMNERRSTTGTRPATINPRTTSIF